MRVRIDGSKRASYIRAHHGIEPLWADEAVSDGYAMWLEPDPASRSGYSVRVIGYSPTRRAVVTVILVSGIADPSERPEGDWWGSNAWLSSPRDQRIYSEVES